MQGNHTSHALRSTRNGHLSNQNREDGHGSNGFQNHQNGQLNRENSPENSLLHSNGNIAKQPNNDGFMQPSSNPYAAKALARKLQVGGHTHESGVNADMSVKEQERMDANRNNAFNRFTSCQNQNSKLFGKYVDGTDKKDRL